MAQHSPGFLRICDEARQRVREVSVEEIERRLERGDHFLLIDVREDHEWTKGRLPKARHLGRGIIERDIEAQVPDSRTEIVLYCGGGFRSALAAESLAKLGYTNVSSMAGGYRAWTTAGYETTED